MKCGHCSNAIGSTNMSGFTAGVPFGTQWKCIAFTCPHCQAVLGTQIDPIAIKTEIVAEVLRGLSRRP